MRNKPKQETTNISTPSIPIHIKKIEMSNWVVGIISGLLFIGISLFGLLCNNKTKDNINKEVIINSPSDSSAMNQVKNDSTRIGRDQINIGRDYIINNNEKTHK